MRVLMLRRQWIALGLFVLVLFAGCATTKPLWFIATPGYVEAQIATSENAIRLEYEAEIARLQDELNAQRAVSDELVALADVIAEIEDSNQELLGLADELEDRLSELPLETIRQLVEILQQHLQESTAE
ncbi:MAG: hypothetical protein KAU31_13525 [Spirochaetaceae bacterium]|nr:hypothetical protein [Spirochaetaceae bacterium]